eukprot:EG_transcript_4562
MLLLLLCLVFGCCSGFYLPGVAPREYLEEENVTVKVNSMKSSHAAVPFDYYSIMVCRPEGKLVREAENLGEILWGDEIKPSLYRFQMLKEVSCVKLCTTKVKEPTKAAKEASKASKRSNSSKVAPGLKSVQKLKRRIDDFYRGHLIMDNLPVSETYFAEGSKTDVSYRVGYPLGTPATKEAPTTVNNHLAFTVKIHKPSGLPGWRIVGFEVKPFSVESSKIDTQCTPGQDFDPAPLPAQTVVVSPADQATKAISWSYSIHWAEEPDVAWSSRWDHYLKSQDGPTIHWFGIVTSSLIVLCLGALVATILMRMLHMDFNRYNNPDDDADLQEETGWKLVHADVFREPKYSALLSCYLGTGSQLLGMSSVTLFFACLGFLSPARRGALMTAMLILFALMGALGGFVTAMLAKMFHEQSWATVFCTGVMFPGQIFVVFFCLNILLWAKEAANAVSFATLIGLVALWFFVSLPLLFMGAKVGYSSETITPPKSVNDIPRQIPPQRPYMNTLFLTLAGGAVSFGAVFIEMYFVLSSLWLNKIYYVFGFFAIIAVILAITCAEVSIVLVYFHLCAEDYHWWWRSFLYAGGCGPCLFLYSIYYLTSTLNMANDASICIYFAYMALLSYSLFVMMGTIGFFSTFVLVRYIYASVKVD